MQGLGFRALGKKASRCSKLTRAMGNGSHSMSYSLSSLKGAYIGNHIGEYYRGY